MTIYTTVDVAAGPGYTDVPATVAAHRVRAYESGVPANQLSVKLPNDNYTTEFVFDIGDKVELRGNGFHGILAHGPGYAYPSQAATLYMKIKAVGDSPFTLILEEIPDPDAS